MNWRTTIAPCPECATEVAAERTASVGSRVHAGGGSEGRHVCSETTAISSARTPSLQSYVPRSGKPAQALKRRLRGSTGPAKRRWQSLLTAVEGSHTQGRVCLDIGGGTGGPGSEVIEQYFGRGLIVTDIYLSDRVNFVADAHRLPVSDGSVDVVICQAVLEHVIDPVQVVSEIRRVLKPRGLAYTEVPFLQAVHEGPYDFTRYTMNGHRALMRNFVEIDSGSCGSASEALVWALANWIGSLTRSRRILRLTKAVLSPVARLAIFEGDRFRSDGTSGTYFIGRNSEFRRSDSEIIASYSGAQK